MKASELRIWNWIYDDEGRLSKIKGMKPFDHSVRCDEEEGCVLLFDYMHPVHGLMDGYECNSNQCDPIPLTPEILEKCGFVFRPEGEEVYEQIWMKGNFEIWEHDTGFCHSYIDGGDVDYLHQLQNLFYALTGEELNYQP